MCTLEQFIQNESVDWGGGYIQVWEIAPRLMKCQNGQQ